MSEFKFCRDCRFRRSSAVLAIYSANDDIALATLAQSICTHPKQVKVDVLALVTGHEPVLSYFLCRTNRESISDDGCGVDAKLFEAKSTDADHGDAQPETFQCAN